MSEYYLEFEAPLVALERKIAELKEFSQTNQIDVSAELNALTKRLQKTTKEIYSSLTPWQRVQLSRHQERPYTLDYIGKMCRDFMELSGDRRFHDDKAVVGGFARLGDYKVMIIGTQKGRDMKSNVYRNFGWPNPEGYRKALRLMKLADRAGVPIITLIDTPGAYPGVSSEERHIAEAIAVNLREMFSLRVPVIAVVIGEGGSGGAIGLGVGNRILVLENGYYSVITPEGCAAILWKDRKFASQAAGALGLTANKLFELGVVDEIVPEPAGGAHRNWDLAAELLKKSLNKHLQELSKFDGDTLQAQRYEKFRRLGNFIEAAHNNNTPETVENK